MSLSVKFGEPRLKVGFPSKPLGVKTGTPIIRGSGDLDPYTGEYTVTPSSSSQTLQTRGLRMTDDVTVEAVAEGSVEIEELLIDMSPSIRVSSSGKITATIPNGSEAIEPTVTPGYVEGVQPSSVSYYGETEYQLSTLSGRTITPSNTTQTISTKNKYMTGNITIDPIPSDYGKITWDGSVLIVS